MPEGTNMPIFHKESQQPLILGTHDTGPLPKRSPGTIHCGQIGSHVIYQCNIPMV